MAAITLPLNSSKIAALSYLAVALTIPFILPLKHSIAQNKNNETTYGSFNVGHAFRI